MKSYSQLKAMMAIAAASFRSLTRSPSTVAFSFFFPIIFLLAFGFLGEGGIKIRVALAPGSNVNNPIYQSLAKSSEISFQSGQSQEKVNKDLLHGDLDAELDIRRSMQQGKPFYWVNVRTTSASQQKGNLFMLILRESVDQVNLHQNTAIRPIAKIQSEKIAGKKYTEIDFILPGQVGFAVLSTAVFGTAFVFLNLRNTLVIKRFFATPIRRIYIVLGEALARLVFSLLGTIFIIVLGYYAFHFTLAHGIVTVINMTILSAIGLLVFMGFGFTISGIAKNDAAVPMMANVVTLPQFILCGTFFSIELFPKWLQHFCYLLPLTYMNDAMRKISFEGAGLFNPAVGKDILILLAWGVVIYLIAGKTFRWE